MKLWFVIGEILWHKVICQSAERVMTLSFKQWKGAIDGHTSINSGASRHNKGQAINEKVEAVFPEGVSTRLQKAWMGKERRNLFWGNKIQSNQRRGTSICGILYGQSVSLSWQNQKVAHLDGNHVEQRQKNTMEAERHYSPPQSHLERQQKTC